MIDELITAFALGLIGGFIPGPVLAAIFTEILQKSFLKSLRIIFIALIIETLVAVISLLFFSSMNFPESVFRIISFIGAGVLTWIAISIWQITKIDIDAQFKFDFGKLTILILSNGVLWTFWITICIPKAIFVSESVFLGDYIFLILVEIGWLITTIFVAFLFSRFRELLSRPKVIPFVFKIFAFTFVYFAIDMIYQSIIFFINF